MNLIDIKKFEESGHILLVTDNASFTNASVLYSYVLTLHKKVSLFSGEPLHTSLSYLPWFDKCRNSLPSSAEQSIRVDSDAQALYYFLKEHSIKINKKMATALYAGYLWQFDGFRSSKIDGTIFADVSELITLQAEYKKCQHFFYNEKPLAFFRLKSLLFARLLLTSDATVAQILISDDDLKQTGASMDDAYEIMKEALQIAHVQEVVLVKDDNREILRRVKEV